MSRYSELEAEHTKAQIALRDRVEHFALACPCGAGSAKNNWDCRSWICNGCRRAYGYNDEDEVRHSEIKAKESTE